MRAEARCRQKTHPPPCSSVAFVSGAAPECVSGKRSDRDDCDQDSAQRECKRLQLKPRSVPVESNEENAAVLKATKLAPNAPWSIFGGARLIDMAARERDIEACLARQREEEEHRRMRNRGLFQQSRKDDLVRRSGVASGSQRKRSSSESGSDSYYNGERQPPSQQCSNDSRHRSKSSQYGSQARCDAPVRDDQGECSHQPPAGRIRRPDSDVKVASALQSTDAVSESYPKRTTLGHLPGTLSSQGGGGISPVARLARDVLRTSDARGPLTGFKSGSCSMARGAMQDGPSFSGTRVCSELASRRS
ncbi:eukaryotic translation initiation factor 4B-like [Rhipicephalus sanguineus]|uniref:eukaryotic translation initiation factor 4B-like n=1 Tax=Rhipicephalus sanguineus TaxID=34632 RepID=UPI0020C441E4|nr:eukaryotic translation initiation factor 4B-like [Rhipicephalus sanguineus]